MVVQVQRHPLDKLVSRTDGAVQPPQDVMPVGVLRINRLPVNLGSAAGLQFGSLCRSKKFVNGSSESNRRQSVQIGATRAKASPPVEAFNFEARYRVVYRLSDDFLRVVTVKPCCIPRAAWSPTVHTST